MNVLAIDLSLDLTGYVTVDGCVHKVTFDKLKRHIVRLTAMRAWLHSLCRDETGAYPQPDVVVVEGYSYGSKGNSLYQIGELRGVLRIELHDMQIPLVEIDPSTIKMFATGGGNAGKPEVIAAAIRRLGYEGHDDNESDALWLWYLTHTIFADDQHSLDLPATHMRALVKPRALNWHGLNPPT